MHPDEVALLLRKQRLQLRIASQRAECLALLREVEGVADTAVRARSLGLRLRGLLHDLVQNLLGGHALLGSAVAAALLLIRPRRTLGWLRRLGSIWWLARRHRSRLGGWLQLLARLAGV